MAGITGAEVAQSRRDPLLEKEESEEVRLEVKLRRLVRALGA